MEPVVSALLNAVVVLRHNTQLGGDVRLACREFDALIGADGTRIGSRTALRKLPLPGIIGRSVELSRADVVAIDYRGVKADRLASLLRRSAFAQEVFVWGFDRPKLDRVSRDLGVPSVVVNAMD